MRKIAITLWATFLLSLGVLLVWGTRKERSHMRFRPNEIPLHLAPVLGVVAVASLFLAIAATGLAWGRTGGDTIASGSGWRDDRGPLPALVPAPPVDTGTILEEYRGKWDTYLPWVRGQFVYAIPGVPALLYGIYMVSVDRAFGPLVQTLALTIVPLVIFGIVHTVLVYSRSAVLVHPNGVTIQGAWRRVVLDNTTNCGVVQGQADTGMYDMGPIYINRATRSRGAIWEESLGADVSVTAIVRTRCPEAVVFTEPSRQLAPYVSIMTRVPLLLLALFVVPIVGISTVTVVLDHVH